MANLESKVTVEIINPGLPHTTNMDFDGDEIHKFELKSKWTAIQLELKKKLIVIDDFKVDEIKLIGGVDISFVKNTMKACACLVVKSWPELKTVYSDVDLITLEYPYIQGFLAFREVPSLMVLIDKLKRNQPHLVPDVIMVDGNGLLHPNRFGLACHLGIISEIPTIGVAKNIMYIDGTDHSQIKADQLAMLDSDIGDYRPIKINNAEIVGNILKTVKHDGMSTMGVGTIYVSIGHRISLDTATKMVTKCIKFKVPEPTREADFISRKFLRDMKIK